MFFYIFLEQTKEAFKTNVLPNSDKTGIRKLIIDILGKGPEAIVKGGVIPPGTKLLDWMDHMTLEAFTIETGLSNVSKYTDIEEVSNKAPMRNTTQEVNKTGEKETGSGGQGVIPYAEHEQYWKQMQMR